METTGPIHTGRHGPLSRCLAPSRSPACRTVMPRAHSDPGEAALNDPVGCQSVRLDLADACLVYPT